MNKNNVPIKSSIGFKLLRAVFGLYVIIAIIVTSGHVAVEESKGRSKGGFCS
jgi:hypothetical protein